MKQKILSFSRNKRTEKNLNFGHTNCIKLRYYELFLPHLPPCMLTLQSPCFLKQHNHPTQFFELKILGLILKLSLFHPPH